METSFEFKDQTGAILRELDVCRSLFESIEHALENNAGLKDLHSWAMLAGEGVRKLDAVADLIDKAT